MKTLIKAFTALCITSILALSAAQAGDLQLKAKKIEPKMTFQATGMAKPATCAAGFTPVGMKLVQHEGHKWYEYSCAQEKLIKRTCNVDTDVTDVKNKFISLPSDGQSHNSKLRMSYKCFNYVPVE